tara:strand:+ start:181 stop:1506 length:1326 start_codon:yes stop_codon:yes gene_type:complete
LIKDVKKMSKGQKLWKKAKKIIPNGNMLLSKNPDQFLPGEWPSYFKKAKGCEVWDLDGRKYFDVSIMGIGTNILGYGNKVVDDAVKNVIKNGNMSTLNCEEEVELAKKLITMHKWADMAKFARSGGEANAIAIRIARAATKKDKIAVCGYHGWHDWYLSSNLSNKKNLDNHLLPDLNIAGVPKVLANTVLPFKYNDIAGLEKIVKKHKLAAIKMEVSRNILPNDNFLESVRKIADQNKIVLIFDECTSGFRECYGGLHIKYGVDPDIAMFGKALGNGYAITAIIGKEKFMNAANETFISSTFWTERIGPAAALATLLEMKKIKSWEKISKIGNFVATSWIKLASKHDLDISVNGLDSIKSFTFNNKHNLIYKTYITQELLKEGFLANNAFYASIAHNKNILSNYIEILDHVFKKIKSFENIKNPIEVLDGPVCETGFKRMN